MADAPLTVGETIGKSTGFLRSKGVDSPRLDAELLLAHVLGWDRLRLYLNWEAALSEADKEKMREMLRRRGIAREPVSRIVGQREFYGRSFRVGAEAFDPRPETEWLVERGVALLKERGAAANPALTPETKPLRVLDIGTGTGCIAISLALECAAAEVVATDISEETLRVARDNASALSASSRVRFVRGDLFAGLEGPFDLVVSNPPYIASAEIEELAPEVKTHDPRRALDGGAGGTAIIERLAAEAPGRMRAGAPLLLEIGEGQGAAVAGILERTGQFEGVRIVRDGAGLERYVEAVARPKEVIATEGTDRTEADRTEAAGAGASATAPEGERESPAAV